MKTNHAHQSTVRRRSVIATTLAILLAIVAPAHPAGNPNPGILPVDSEAFGQSLAEWSAVWWQLGIEHPVSGNPFLEGGAVELSGSVLGIAAPLGGATFEITIRSGKAVFLPAITIECSSLEPPESGFHGDTEAEQAECAAYWADHIIDLSLEIDELPVQNLATYRVVSPQFPFTAPDPNILGVTGGGPGTAVADGYYVMLAPLSKGVHTTRLRGILHFSIAEGDPFDLELVTDNTFHINVK